MKPPEPTVTFEPWRLRVTNFRALHAIDWTPSGVCLLAGPNGSGKSTLLKALQFPRFYYRDGRTTALGYLSGASNLRRLGASEEEPVSFEIEQGGISWRVEIPIEGVGVHPYFGERLTHGDEVLLDARRYEGAVEYQGRMHPRKDGDRCALRRVWHDHPPTALARFVTRLQSIRVHYSYSLDAVRLRSASGSTPNEYLHPTGQNLWAVLHHWRRQGESSPAHANAQAWVLDQARRAFPDIISDIQFDDAGEPRIYIPNQEQGLQAHLAADGLLVGLMHLTATAGAAQGSILAFDEMENQLHPHAIRSILAAMRERAEEYDLTIILTTHSPVLMNEFKNDEQSFYVLDRPADSTNPFPTPLDELKDPAWLKHFALGDLYDREEFAAPERGPT